MKKILTVKSRNKSAMVGDFKTCLLVIKRITRQEISKDVEDLHNSSSHLNVTFTEYIQTSAKHLFSNAHGMLTKIDHNLNFL